MDSRTAVMTSVRTVDLFPGVPLEEWEASKDTLHLFLQIVGKIRLGLFPKMNHWWHVPFYVSSRGLTTRAIPVDLRNVTLEFDFIDHQLVISTSGGFRREIDLPGLSVAQFHREVFAQLEDLAIECRILSVPTIFSISGPRRFLTTRIMPRTTRYFVQRAWQVPVQVNGVFQQFRGRFLGKSTPVHLFWHHFDLAVTFFTGREAPPREGAGIVEREAYSHEVISFGFWFGDKTIREPAFYAYGAPVPEGLEHEPLRPEAAMYDPPRREVRC